MTAPKKSVYSCGMLRVTSCVTVQGVNENRFTSASNAFTRYTVLWSGNGWMPTFTEAPCPICQIVTGDEQITWTF